MEKQSIFHCGNRVIAAYGKAVGGALDYDRAGKKRRYLLFHRIYHPICGAYTGFIFAIQQLRDRAGIDQRSFYGKAHVLQVLRLHRRYNAAAYACNIAAT